MTRFFPAIQNIVPPQKFRFISRLSYIIWEKRKKIYLLRKKAGEQKLPGRKTAISSIS